MRTDPINLLEIGIQNGVSLDIWGSYLPNASLIIGCEIKQEAAQLKYSNEAINVVVGDANSDEIFQQIIKLSDSYDLIIDDGSHVSKDIITSFARYFPLLKSGGIYIIEDLHASYWKVWGGGLAYPLSSISFLKRLIDVIHKSIGGYQKNIHGFLIYSL